MRWLTALCLVVCSATGCAYTVVKPLAAGDRTARGFRFYDPRPYLLEGCTKLEVIYLPDFSRAYAAQPRAWLAKNDYDFHFAAGQLAETHGTLDTTALLTLLQGLGSEAIEQAGTLAALSASDSTGAQNRRTAVLYSLSFDESGAVSGATPIPLGECPSSAPASRSGAPQPASGGKKK